MAPIHLVRAVPVPVEQAWSAVTDLAAHADGVPFTTMRCDPLPVHAGWRFAATTGFGPLRFVDTMVVDVWEPPGPQRRRGTMTVRKTGRVLAGYAEIRVDEVGPDRSAVTWTEEILVRPDRLGALLAPVVDPVAGLVFGRALDRLLASVAR